MTRAVCSSTAGTPAGVGGYSEALAARGLEPADIGTVVLSHGHWDHVQNVDFFQEARVPLHADELDNLENPPSTDLGTPRWARRISTTWTSR